MINAFDSRRSETKPTAKRTTVVIDSNGTVLMHIDPFDAAEGPSRLLGKLKRMQNGTKGQRLRGSNAHSFFHHSEHLRVM